MVQSRTLSRTRSAWGPGVSMDRRKHLDGTGDAHEPFPSDVPERGDHDVTSPASFGGRGGARDDQDDREDTDPNASGGWPEHEWTEADIPRLDVPPSASPP